MTLSPVRITTRTRLMIASAASVTAALALAACSADQEPQSPSRAGSASADTTATAAADASAGRPSPITALGLRAGDLPAAFVTTDSEPVVTPALDAQLRRCTSLPAAPRAIETHRSGWDRDRRRQDSAVLTTASRYADQASATRYTGVATADGAAACFDKVLTRSFQGTGDSYARIAPHSAVVKAPTSAEPSNVTAVVSYRLRSAPPAGIDPAYGQVDIYYVTGPRVGAALTYFAFNEAPDDAVRIKALNQFAARIARG